jgi:NADPH:quinone reductase-like Zn-dependent oxidoreductase
VSKGDTILDIENEGSVMRAVRLLTPDGPAGLAIEEVAQPRPGPGEVLVRVHAAAITRDELDWPTDRLPATPSYEMSGVVASVASDVTGWMEGNEVYALTGFDRDGAAADYAVVPAAYLARKPRSLGHVESAAIPLAGLTAWQGLFDHGRLEPKQRVLIHGAAGGVGSIAVQLACWRGAHVIATVSRRSVDLVRELGAHEVIEHPSTRFEDVAGSVDLVFDTAGGERLERSPAVLTAGGRLVSVATEPPVLPGLDATYFVVEPRADQLVELARLSDAGLVRPMVNEVFELGQARAAFERTLSGGGRGKVVLRVTA